MPQKVIEMTKESHYMMLCSRRENHIVFKCINKDAWDLFPVYKMAFYFQRHYIVTIKNRSIP